MARRRFASYELKGWDVVMNLVIFGSELWQLTRNCWWWWSGALISSHFLLFPFHSAYGPLGRRWPGNVWQSVCKLTETHSLSFSFSADHTTFLCRVCFESPLPSTAESLLMVINYNGTTLALPNAQALIHTDTSSSSSFSVSILHTLFRVQTGETLLLLLLLLAIINDAVRAVAVVINVCCSVQCQCMMLYSVCSSCCVLVTDFHTVHSLLCFAHWAAAESWHDGVY